MKKSLAITWIMGSLMWMMSGCYQDVLDPLKPLDTSNPPRQVSFSGEIAPLLNNSCAKSGCHDDIPTKVPSLTTANSYNSLMNGGYINTDEPEKSGLYLSVKNDFMPPSSPLTNAEKLGILDWIRIGAPNN